MMESKFTPNSLLPLQKSEFTGSDDAELTSLTIGQYFKNVVDNYDETIFIEEALFRLVEIYYKIGLENESTAAAALLGYNYGSSEWYKKSYKILNKDYKIPVKKVNKKDNLVKRTIKKILLIDEK